MVEIPPILPEELDQIKREVRCEIVNGDLYTLLRIQKLCVPLGIELEPPLSPRVSKQLLSTLGRPRSQSDNEGQISRSTPGSPQTLHRGVSNETPSTVSSDLGALRIGRASSSDAAIPAAAPTASNALAELVKGASDVS